MTIILIFFSAIEIALGQPVCTLLFPTKHLIDSAEENITLLSPLSKQITDNIVYSVYMIMKDYMIMKMITAVT